MLSAAAANLSYVGRRLLRLLFTLAAGVTLAGQSLTRSSIQPQPIIDVHLHAYAPADWKGPSPNPVTGKAGPATAEEHMRQTLFDSGHLSQPYHSINTDVHKRIRYLSEGT